jgi:hypothetical protein
MEDLKKWRTENGEMRCTDPSTDGRSVECRSPRHDERQFEAKDKVEFTP